MSIPSPVQPAQPIPPAHGAPLGLGSPPVLLGGAALASVAAVGFALVSQHVFGMEPCPWCILQRVVFLAIALVCLLGLAGRYPAVRGVAGGLGAALALAGMAAALWQHLVAAASDSCAVTLAERIVSALGLDTLAPDLFYAMAGCGDAAASLLGVPYPLWSLAIFVLVGVACGRAAGLSLASRPRAP